MEARFAELAALLPAARARAHRGGAAAGGGRARAGPPRRAGATEIAAPARGACGSSSAGSRATWRSRPSGSANAETSARRARRTSGRQMELRAQQAAAEQEAAAADRECRRRRARADPGGAGRSRRRGGGGAPPPGRAAQRGARAGAGAPAPGPDPPVAGGRARGARGRARLAARAGRPRPRPIAPRSRSSWRARSAGATTRSSGPASRATRPRRAAADAEHARHLVAEAREREAMHRADRRQAEETLAQLTARRHALEELERDRVGLAPAAAALLAARERFDGGVLGPLSDYRHHRSRGRRAGRAAAGRLDARGAGARRGDGARGAGLARGAAAGRPGAAPARSRTAAAERRPLGGRPAPRRGAWLRAGCARRSRAPRYWTRRAASFAVPAERSSSAVPGLRRDRSGAGPSWRTWVRRWSGPGPPLPLPKRRCGRPSTQLAQRERALSETVAAADAAREAERQAVAAREDAARRRPT